MPTSLETILQLQGLQRKGSLEQLIRALILLASQQAQAQPTAPATAPTSNILSNALGIGPEGIPLVPSAEEVGRGISPGAVGGAALNIGKTIAPSVIEQAVRGQIADAIFRNFGPALASGFREAGPTRLFEGISAAGIPAEALRGPSETFIDAQKLIEAFRGTTSDLSKINVLGQSLFPSLGTASSSFTVPLATRLSNLMTASTAPTSVFDAARTLSTGAGATSIPTTLPAGGGLSSTLQSINRIAGPVGLGISGALNIKDIFSGNAASGGAGLGGMGLGALVGSLTPLGPIGGAAIGGTVGKLFGGLFGGGRKPDRKYQQALAQQRILDEQNRNNRIGELNQALGEVRGFLESGDVNNVRLLQQLGRAASQANIAGIANPAGPTLSAIAPSITTNTIREFLNTGREGMTREQQMNAARAAAGPKPQSLVSLAYQYPRGGQRVSIGPNITYNRLGQRIETPEPVDKVATADYQRRLSGWNKLLKRHMDAEMLYDKGVQALDLIDSGKFEEGKKLYTDVYRGFAQGDQPPGSEGLTVQYGIVNELLKNMGVV